MTQYNVPTRDMRFVIEDLAGLESLRALPPFADADADVVEAVLTEAARLAQEVLAPLNRAGDTEGVRLENGNVHETPGFAEAYRQFADGGWNALPFSTDIGGGGLPNVVGFATNEMWHAANMAFALCPMLTQAAVEALEQHGSEEQQRRYLDRLISGEWTATMDLTEPQAGSDLAQVRCQAVPAGDHYLLHGQKIYITWGDHQMTDNVLHMVLARLPDAPAGVKGISLFVVPKFLVREDGTLGERNDMRPVSVEHKLGIHASPTCVMSFGDEGGAVGYLVGGEHNGLACMFTMMNHARLNVGVQGLAIADRAYQLAVHYARDRVQGNAPGQASPVTIVHHPDVRRMLMSMKAQIEAMRALSLVAAASMDHSHHQTDAGQRARHAARLDLLVPVVKAWCTEQAQEVASVALQVHGGMGYVEETGAAQHYRDARITTIYEGTTGIQAQDLVRRKILRDGGRAMRSLLEDIRATAADLGRAELGDMQRSLDRGADVLQQAAERLLEGSGDDPHLAGAASYAMVMLTGTVAGGWQMARAALAARRRLEQGAGGSDFYRAKIVTARFYAEHILPRAGAYGDAVFAGSDTIMALDEDQFLS